MADFKLALRQTRSLTHTNSSGTDNSKQFEEAAEESTSGESEKKKHVLDYDDW